MICSHHSAHHIPKTLSLICNLFACDRHNNFSSPWKQVRSHTFYYPLVCKYSQESTQISMYDSPSSDYLNSLNKLISPFSYVCVVQIRLWSDLHWLEHLLSCFFRIRIRFLQSGQLSKTSVFRPCWWYAFLPFPPILTRVRITPDLVRCSLLSEVYLMGMNAERRVFLIPKSGIFLAMKCR